MLILHGLVCRRAAIAAEMWLQKIKPMMCYLYICSCCMLSCHCCQCHPPLHWNPPFLHFGPLLVVIITTVAYPNWLLLLLLSLLSLSDTREYSLLGGSSVSYDRWRRRGALYANKGGGGGGQQWAHPAPTTSTFSNIMTMIMLQWLVPSDTGTPSTTAVPTSTSTRSSVLPAGCMATTVAHQKYSARWDIKHWPAMPQ